MSGRSGAHLGVLCGLVAVAGCNGSLYATSTSQHGQTSSRASNSAGSGAGSGGGTGTSGSAGGNTTGPSGSNTGTSGGPPGCAAACNLPGQFCDDAGQCVVCLDDAQCTSPVQPLCFNDAGPSFGTCVQCLASSNCQPGDICDTSMSCVPGCFDTQACTGQTPICADSGMCVSCLSAAECSGGLVCRQGTCTVCQNDFECAENYVNLTVCSPEENCVECVNDADCPVGHPCVGTVCQ